MISQNACVRKAGDPSLSQGPAHKLPRHGPALCTPGVVVPPLPASQDAVSLAPPTARRLREARRTRTARVS